MSGFQRRFGATSRSAYHSSSGLRHRRLRLEGLETRDLLAAVIISPTAGLTTSEDGGSAVVSVVLKDAPTADVVIPLTSSNTKEGVVSASELVFTPENYNKVQTFRITGVPDGVKDGNKSYTVVTGAAQSADPAYNGLKVADVKVKNLDSRTLIAGITVTPTKGLETTENGGTASFTIKLNYPPDSPVFIPISSSKPKEGLADVSGVTFDATNWNVPQTITVTGQPDDIFDGNQSYKIITGAAQSLDKKYNKKNPSDVSLVNKDRDDVGRFDGVYVGTYSGKASVPGFGSSPVKGSVRFVVENGVITVMEPGAGSGTVSATGSAGFGTAGGAVSGATFSGVFRGIKNKSGVKATGSWDYLEDLVIAHGTWTVTRV